MLHVKMVREVANVKATRVRKQLRKRGRDMLLRRRGSRGIVRGDGVGIYECEGEGRASNECR